MTRVLVLNSGSSSLKVQIVDTERADDDAAIMSALVERIGASGGRLHLHRAASDDPTVSGEAVAVDEDFPDHAQALHRVLKVAAELQVHPDDVRVQAVGHRVVHGGATFHAPTVITTEVERGIEDLRLLAPLHNPPNLVGIQVARKLLPNLDHVAVFDTGFFHTLTPQAYTYAIDRQRAEQWGIRRYGFHGTSHEFVSHRAAQMLDRPYEDLNQIVMHLGNGASASAIGRGHAVDTSMGLTPLEGLVMGTRPGDLDPGVMTHLIRDRGMSAQDVSTMLNKQSGLQGLCGVSDFREVVELVESGDEQARLAYDVVVHRLRKYVGAYWALLGELDVISFTAGVGENSPVLRADALATLESWGVVIDPQANAAGAPARVISTPESAVTVLVVPTNEELAIARSCDALLGLS